MKSYSIISPQSASPKNRIELSLSKIAKLSLEWLDGNLNRNKSLISLLLSITSSNNLMSTDLSLCLYSKYIWSIQTQSQLD